ncbi:MAG: diaminopimelate decarboxylase [Balneolales bacterium]
MQARYNFQADPDRLLAIAHKWGTPTYVYNEKIIRDRCRKLQKLFPDLPVAWLYAVKANDNPHILEIIHNEGMGFDTVSYEEVLLCRKLGVDPGEIFYTENNMTDAEMNAAATMGVTLNIGSLGRLRLFCETYPGSSCSIRLKPDISDGHHVKVDTGNEDSKFGIRMDHIPDVRRLSKEHQVRIRGIHAHIGSGIRKPENLLAEIKILLKAAQEFTHLEFINFGGGIPIPYQNDEEEFNLSGFAELASPDFRDFLEQNDLETTFYFEPGRFIVGPAGLLLTQVNTVKDQGRKIFLGTDTGFNHLLRPALYDAFHEVVNLSTGAISDKTAVYDIAGNICESGDILAFNRSLPITSPGDYLAILDTGAYGMTMSSYYNRRALPAEVMITDDGFHKIIRDRISAAETVDKFLVETGKQPKPIS